MWFLTTYRRCPEDDTATHSRAPACIRARNKLGHVSSQVAASTHSSSASSYCAPADGFFRAFVTFTACAARRSGDASKRQAGHAQIQGSSKYDHGLFETFRSEAALFILDNCLLFPSVSPAGGARPLAGGSETGLGACEVMLINAAGS